MAEYSNQPSLGRMASNIASQRGRSPSTSPHIGGEGEWQSYGTRQFSDQPYVGQQYTSTGQQFSGQSPYSSQFDQQSAGLGGQQQFYGGQGYQQGGYQSGSFQSGTGYYPAGATGGWLNSLQNTFFNGLHTVQNSFHNVSNSLLGGGSGAATTTAIGQQNWMQGAGKWVLITGGSTGIGFQFAKLFAQKGYNLVIVGRDQSELSLARDELSRFGNIRVLPIARDLGVPTGARDLYDDIRSQGIQIDILISNAGQCGFGKFLETELERHVSMIWLNLFNMVVLSYLFGREFVSRGQGKILLMSALHSVAPNPNHAVYAACGKFIKSFGCALSYELKGTNVSVTTLLPGFTSDTNWVARSGRPLPRAYQGWFPLTSPERVATSGVTGLLGGKHTVVPGFFNWIAFHLSPFIPDFLLAPAFNFLNSPAY